MKALVSIHDVMPHTLERVECILKWLNERHVPPVTLLVVPGRPWEEKQIERLHKLAESGHELAAHGWRHETTPRKISHRIHASLISRNVAEHLDLDGKGVLDLMIRSGKWFGDNELPIPDFYVPPAWAIGPVSKKDLAQVPFKLIETTRGLIHIGQKVTFQKLPLSGYEADTTLREVFLRHWNTTQQCSAQRKDLPLRISIHPDDLDLRVADQLDKHVQSTEVFFSYREFSTRAH